VNEEGAACIANVGRKATYRFSRERPDGCGDPVREKHCAHTISEEQLTI